MKTEKIHLIVSELLRVLEEHHDTLLSEYQAITGECMYFAEKDLLFVTSYLSHYIEVVYAKTKKENQKAKGKILLFLSHNEPFTMSVIPIINALVSGNIVHVKPSSRCFHFMNMIWGTELFDGMLENKLIILDQESKSAEVAVKSISFMNAVFFFGSQKSATHIAQECAKHLVEFQQEIEATDVAVISDHCVGSTTFDNIADSILKDSFSHAGQQCQRIQGVYVDKIHFEEFKNVLLSHFNTMVTTGDIRTFVTANQLQVSIYDFISKEDCVVSNNTSFPFVVIQPIDKKFITTALFFPTLWLVPFENTEDLLSQLNKRIFFNGINVWTLDQGFLQNIIEKTPYSRITVNTSHTQIEIADEWGGVTPSGTGGTKSWLERFSNRFEIKVVR